MGRIVILVLGLAAAAAPASLFATVAHDDLGTAIDTIRNGALTSAGIAAVAVGILLG